MTAGALAGTRVIELAGIGPAPFAGMVLADMGAEVIRVDRPGPGVEPADMANRGKRSIRVDLKQVEGAEVVRELAASAEILIEGLRPGVAERLGVGPEQCFQRNPGLVYGRVTGWGQDGPLVSAAGHDINYIALAGALAHMGRAGDKPTPPMNMVGDFGGGGMLLVIGVLAALLEARASGSGQVVDAAMIDGAALQMTMIHDLASRGRWNDARGTNLLDTGAPFYDTYETADHKYVSVGAIEPQFFATLAELLGWSVDEVPNHLSPGEWPGLRARLAAEFLTRTRDEWIEILEGTDACFAPVLSMTEARMHPHNRQRRLFVEVDGRSQPAPAPRFSRTPSPTPRPAPSVGEDTAEILASIGMDDEAITSLSRRHIVQ